MTTRVLVVCQANRCRSPYAAEILTRATSGKGVTVESQGFLPGGAPMPETGQELGKELGMDFSAHRSREFAAYRAGEFDLVLTMARDQSRVVAAEAPDVWPRVFTVPQFEPWLREHPVPEGQRLGEWITQAARDRTRSELVQRRSAEGIDDPFGKPMSAWRKMVAQLAPLLTSIGDGIPSR